MTTPPGFAPSGFFVLRTPLLPFDELRAWGQGLLAPSARGASTAGLEAALARDRELLRERLASVIARPEVREALFLASPSLEENLPAWTAAPGSPHAEKLERTLVRYWQRMTARATPFGLFAGNSVGTFNAATRLRLPARETYRRHTRLDMDYVDALTDGLAGLPALREALSYRPNSSLYRAAGRLRYAESRRDGGSRSYQLVGVEPTPYLEATLEQARAGASLAALVQSLLDADPDVSREEATEYVDMLVAHQLLVPELAPLVTGPEPVRELLARLEAVPAMAGPHRVLGHVQGVLTELDGSPPGAEPSRYRALARGLEALPAPVNPSRLFQVDLRKPAEALTLGPAVVDAMSQGVALLHRLSPASESATLRRFREAFVQRYEAREVPLLEALDEDVGIGFELASPESAEASPLLRDLPFPASRADEQIPWGKAQAHLHYRLSEVLRSGGPLELDADDVEALANPRSGPLPEAFSVMGTVLAASQEDVDAGRFQFVFESMIGPSGAALLGRFCHGDPELLRHVTAHLRAEEALRPEALFAEVVHLPEGRVGNILCRPVLRDHELVYLGRSGAPPERQLPLTDLYLSVQGSRIVLRSASLGREVLPRVTHVHNFGRAHLRPYTFLGTLQQQGVTPGLRWHWGPLASSAFLPRVTAGRLILYRARWRLQASTLRALGEREGAERFREVGRLRERLGLPRLVGLVDQDNVLPVDLDNVLSLDTFVHLVRQRTDVVLVELLADEGLCVQGPEGRFVHEVVVPFVRGAPAVPAPTVPLPKPPRLQRSFPPGSEWLYVKLYTGTALADRVLAEAVAPLAREALASGAAKQWFFLRYGDPDWHLRVRFQGDPRRLHTEVLERLHALLAPLRQDGLVHRVQVDTYERELERYGGDAGLPLAEQWFHADSEAALELLDTVAGDDGADARWRLVLWGIDSLLTDLGFDLEGRCRLLAGLRQGYGQEFSVDGAFERRLGERFRTHRQELEALLWQPGPAEGPLAPGLAVLRRRSERQGPVLARLRASADQGQLTQPLERVAASLVHMHTNRMLRTAARAQELVLYDFLHRLYTSRQAREKKRS
ncbi:Lanthionine biosynthesis protein LanB [Corallococcus sp. CA053C]|uniref:lantibiotic dehydratase n=1 Tax=Corallococcus sp. CA053C TaxID=2316732 RepID=UPI000EA2E6C7|nr:lantibiotic dehydratase [Corallococcus sp. CA053C]RKH13386.1 Lanthionine biosynthesis protein LanB [Corallococcus sp. CA053C]